MTHLFRVWDRVERVPVSPRLLVKEARQLRDTMNALNTDTRQVHKGGCGAGAGFLQFGCPCKRYSISARKRWKGKKRG